MSLTVPRSWNFPEFFTIFLVLLSEFTHCFTTSRHPLTNGRTYTRDQLFLYTKSPYYTHVSSTHTKDKPATTPSFVVSRRSIPLGTGANEYDEIPTITTSSPTTTTTTTSSLSSQLQFLFRNDQVDSIQQFATRIQTSLLQRKDFESFVLNGPKSPRRKKGKKTMTGDSGGGGSEEKRKKIEAQRERLRGSVRLVHGRLIQLHSKKRASVGKKKRNRNEPVVADDAASVTATEMDIFLQVTVKYHGATDVVQNWKLTDGIQQNIIQLMIPAGTTSTTDTATESLMLSEWGAGILDNSTIAELGFQSAELLTSDGTWMLDLATRNNKPKTKSQASCHFVENNTSISPDGNAKYGSNTIKASLRPLSHDQPKNVLLPPSANFFQKLGISDTKGNPKIGMSSKLRQCQKFVEIVSSLVNKYAARALPHENTPEGQQSRDYDADERQKKPVLRTTDMGCGRGYLTFSLHYHLMERYSQKFDVVTRGIDIRPKLVKEINGIASDLGGSFGQHIYFTEGTIADATTSNVQQKDDELERHQSMGMKDNDIDILIALHACDTATDDSIWYGIQRNSSIIVTAPCCHKEVRMYLDPHVAQLRNLEHPLADMLRHNIYKERIAETVTDSIRALLLEIANYDVQVFEFIGGEHTSKNVMITALKRKTPRTKAQIENMRNRLKALASLHGITRQKLAQWMNEVLVDQKDRKPNVDRSMISSTGMPKITPNGSRSE